MRRTSNSWKSFGVTLWVIAVLIALAGMIAAYGGQLGLEQNHHKSLAFLLSVFIAVVAYQAPRLLKYLRQQRHREQGVLNKVYPDADAPLLPPRREVPDAAEVRNTCAPTTAPSGVTTSACCWWSVSRRRLTLSLRA